MVPRTAPGTPAGVARRGPRPAKGGRNVLRSRRARAREAPRPVPEPLGSLPADRDAGRMNVRRATDADQAVLRELWQEFEAEVPEPPGTAPETWEEEWADVRADLDGGAVYLAEDDEGVAGMARAAAPTHGRSHLGVVHVRPRARRQGVATDLVRACVAEVKARGATRVS